MMLAGALISGLLLAVPPAPSVSAADYMVVVYPSVPGKQIRKQDLAAVFLGRAKEWADHTPTSPVDQSAKSEVRAEFSREILGVPVAGALQYWSKAIVDGLRPPAVRGSDAEVLAFVAATEGAIGYVSSGAGIPDGVRVLEIVD